MNLLDTVFARYASLVLNLEIYEFGRAVVTYLRKPVGNSKIYPLDIEVQYIRSYLKKQTECKFKSFYNIVSYC